ncbi:hypothetical protein V6N13_016901 [Hibiscus sabdariffa]
MVLGFTTSILSSPPLEGSPNSQNGHVMVPPHDVRNDGSAPLEGVGLQVPVPMGSQGADVAETHPASEGEAAGETVQFEHRLPSAVCNNTPLSHPPVATPIVSSANSLPQDTGHCSDTQRESCGEAAVLGEMGECCKYG